MLKNTNDEKCLTRGLLFLSKKFKIIFYVIIVYFVVLIAYDFIMFKRSTEDVLLTYLSTAIVSVFCWFGFKLVFAVQIKNKSCPEIFLNIFILAGLIVFGIGSVFIGVMYFTEGFSSAAFISPIIFITVLKVNLLRIDQ